MRKKKTNTLSTIKIDLNDELIQIKAKDMIVGSMMYATPEIMIISKNGECWLNPDVQVFTCPELLSDRIIGVLKDIDNKYIVFARGTNIFWELYLDKVSDCLPIKEIKNIATEILEYQIKEQEEFFLTNDDDDEESW